MGNAIAHTVSSYEFLVFSVNSLLSLSRSRWFHLVPGGSNSFKVVLACSSWFQVVSTYFSLFLVLVCTLQDTCAAFLLFLSVKIMRSRDCSSMPVYTNWKVIEWLQSFWMKVSFLMNITFLNEFKKDLMNTSCWVSDSLPRLPLSQLFWRKSRPTKVSNVFNTAPYFYNSISLILNVFAWQLNNRAH